ncbi:MAG: hypothetical protein ABIS44_04680 [Mycobacteriales bacterium]
MRGRLGARRLVLLVLTPLVAFYCYLILRIAWALWRDGRLASRGTGAALVVLVVVTLALLAAELRFGRQVEQMSKAYDEAPDDVPAAEPLPLAPSGRPDRAAADEAFERVKLRVEEEPGDWRRWYELGLAYGDARDTSRGRRAMRRAIVLKAGER